MPRRDYRRNEKTDLLAAVALIVAICVLTVIMVAVLLTLNSILIT